MSHSPKQSVPPTEGRHLSEVDFRNLIAGTLTGDTLTAAEQHLETCRQCEAAFDRVADLMQLENQRSEATAAKQDARPELVERIRALAESQVDELSESCEAAAHFEARFSYVGPTMKGGLGEVSVYRDEQLHRLVAIKSLRQDKAVTPGRVYRFQREYDITTRLQHPGVPAVMGRGHHADGREFYVMQYIRGETLERAIDRFHNQSAPVLRRSNAEFVRLIEQLIEVCNTIGAAHAQRIVHRDLKAENIVIDSDDRAVVLDWGLAAFLNQSSEPMSDAQNASRADGLTADEPEHVHLTHDRQSLGTIAWMSPEQAAGNSELYDQQTDVYGLGAILYSLLTGVAPHSDSAGGWQQSDGRVHLNVPDRLAQIADGRHPEVHHVHHAVIPRELASICRAAMHPHKISRPSNARDVANQLRAWLTMEPVSTHRYSTFERWARLMARYPAVIMLSVGLLLAICAGLWMYAGSRQAELMAENYGRRQAAGSSSAAISRLYDQVVATSQQVQTSSPQEHLLPLLPVADGLNEQGAHAASEFRLEPRMAVGEFVLQALQLIDESTGTTSPRNVVEQARMLVCLAGIEMFEKRQWIAAEERYQKAIELIGNALAMPAVSKAERSSLLLTQIGLQNGMCLLCRSTDRLNESRAWIVKAQATLTELESALPKGDFHLMRETGVLLERHAEILKSDGFTTEAIQLLRQTCAVITVEDVQRLSNQQLCDQAWILRQDLIILLRDQRRFEEALPVLRELRDIQSASPRGKKTNDLIHLTDATRIRKLAADIYFGLEQTDSAIAELQQAADALRPLHQATPGNSEVRYQLSSIEAKLGNVLRQVDRPVEALPHLLEDWRLTQLELQASGMQDPQVIYDAASVTLCGLGETYASLNEAETAIEYFQKARDLLPARDQDMSRPAFIALNTVLNRWAALYASRSEFAEAVALREELDVAARPFIAREPQNLKNLENVAVNLYLLGGLVRNQVEQALEAEEVAPPDESAETLPDARKTAQKALRLRKELKALMTEILSRHAAQDFREATTESPEQLRSILGGVEQEILLLEQVVQQLPEPKS